MQSPFPRRLRRYDVILSIYPVALIIAVILTLLIPQRSGIAATGQVFAHMLFAPLLLLAPFTLLPSTALLRFALTAAAVIFLSVYAPPLRLGSPAAAEKPALTVLSWNLHFSDAFPHELRMALDRYQPDIAALQEVYPDQFAEGADLLSGYPYRLINRHANPIAVAILSRYPVIESGMPARDGTTMPVLRAIWARIDLGGRVVTVVNAHPSPPLGSCRSLWCYNHSPRDRQIIAIRALVESLRQRTGDPLILVGDMNVTEREPAYRDLADGLYDAHRVAGVGFGYTWRPMSMNRLPGILRIDYMFTDDQVRTLTFRSDCTYRASDHCLIVGQFSFE